MEQNVREKAGSNPLARPSFHALLGAIGLLLALFGILLYFQSQPGQWLMLDFRDWRISFHSADGFSRVLPVQEYEELQPGSEAQRPFSLALQFPAIPGRSEKVVASRDILLAEQNTNYCFSVFVESPYFNPDSAYAIESFNVYAIANGERSQVISIAEHQDPVLLEIESISPGAEGSISLALVVESLKDLPNPSWKRASLVRFDFADLYQCI